MSALTESCKLEDIQYGAKCYIYFPADGNGNPKLERLDIEDAQEAAQMSDEVYYYCHACTEEWHDWEKVKEHIDSEITQ